MNKQDLDILRLIGSTSEWVSLGTPNSSYAARDKNPKPPPRGQLKRLLDAGYIMVRTSTYRKWGGRAAQEAFAKEWGKSTLWGLEGDARAAYVDRFIDKVQIEARLTAQGADVLGAHS